MRPRSLRKSCMLARPVVSDQTGTLKLLTATTTASNANGTLSPISLAPFAPCPTLVRMLETLIRGKTAVCDPDQILHMVVSLVFEAEVFGGAVV